MLGNGELGPAIGWIILWHYGSSGALLSDGPLEIV